MDMTTVGTLIVLALVDSTSFGTLLIPVWLLMTPGRVRLGRVGLFLATAVLCYFAIGLVLLLGASALREGFSAVSNTDAFLVGQLVLGAGLVVVSHFMDNKTARPRAAERAAHGGGRISRWRARAMGTDESGGATPALLILAVVAVLAEVATMLPYLAAIGIITTEGPGLPGDIGLLAGYCVVMIAPALALSIGRVVARAALERPLSRLDRWLTKHAQSTTAWIIGIVGVLLALRAISDLGLIGG